MSPKSNASKNILVSPSTHMPSASKIDPPYLELQAVDAADITLLRDGWKDLNKNWWGGDSRRCTEWSLQVKPLKNDLKIDFFASFASSVSPLSANSSEMPGLCCTHQTRKGCWAVVLGSVAMSPKGEEAERHVPPHRTSAHHHHHCTVLHYMLWWTVVIQHLLVILHYTNTL